ncbi:GntR family transcriptional regulator [Streptomyces sp. ISL-36]|uniref:GntR family transcriptional regulator n=1 Tax=Streptomyces sp. ISL-36 TaxID=2819182 RepID=UPI001BECD013|nr:GntR family transcriptional regulator [Streptomyces sp. ISL-36]MBT2442365.1 GntR family transcriptional regulator [Streptomyces sp. ISL-36]
MEALRPVNRTLLRDRAYDALRDAIVRGDLAPGSVVKDADLAERLGLSRAPVREALARLGDEGLVESKPQSYTRVTRLVSRVVRDAAAVVRVMHELAARTAVPLLGPDGIRAMREANARFAAAVRSADVEAALRADDELHDVLVRASGNHALAATITRYTPLIRRVERRLFGDAGSCGSAALHDRLIEACAAGDAEEAVRVTTEIWRALEHLADDATEPAPPRPSPEPGGQPSVPAPEFRPQDR